MSAIFGWLYFKRYFFVLTIMTITAHNENLDTEFSVGSRPDDYCIR
jgi:hypothetical protein